jgi:hypothetical protein
MGVGRGAKSYERKKAWFSINHSTLSVSPLPASIICYTNKAKYDNLTTRLCLLISISHISGGRGFVSPQYSKIRVLYSVEKQNKFRKKRKQEELLEGRIYWRSRWEPKEREWEPWRNWETKAKVVVV